MSRELRATAALMKENEKQEEVKREGHVTATGELGINAGHQAGELQNLSESRIMGFPAYKKAKAILVLVLVTFVLQHP